MNTLLNRATVVMILGLFSLACPVPAQLPLPTSSQFDLLGFLEEATLDPGGLAGDVMAGGALSVNGHRVVVPRNTLVEFPANAMTWQQVFAQAPLPYGLASLAGPQTGLALNDGSVILGIPAPLTTYEVHVIGNRVGDTYIAGLVEISQQGLNAGAGYINFIDYVNGEMRVGGVLGDPTTGARVRINDPIGRFSRMQSPDIRFTMDEENPTVRSETGYPMGLATNDPAILEDPVRPRRNRPVDGTGNFVSRFTMAAPGTGFPDPTLQVPFEIGDFISFAGTLVRNVPASTTDGPTAGPFPALPPVGLGAEGTYISAHTIIGNLGIYTAPGTQPAYVAIDVTILGVGGVTSIGLTEAAVRTKFEGFCTDPSRIIHLYGIDVNCTNGTTSDRDWGSVDVDPGPPGGAVKGRWRFVPPTRVLTMPAGGIFLPATREMRAVLAGAWAPGQTTTYANGLLAGQYRAPVLEFLFPENIVGAPVPPANFETIPFLARGGLTVSDPATGDVLGLTAQLAPWPGSPIPASCSGPAPQNPTANAGVSQSVASGAVVTLDGSLSSDPNGLTLSYNWAQTAGTAIVLTGSNTVRPVFTAPVVPITGLPVVLTFRLIVTNSVPLSSAAASVNVTVNPDSAVLLPIADAGLPQTVPSGTAPVTLSGAGSHDPNTPALPLTYNWAQTAGPAVLLSGSNTATATFSAPVIAGAPAVLGFALAVNNGFKSATNATTVTVNSIPDVVTVTSVEYRTGKQRLTVNASSSIIDPSVRLTLVGGGGWPDTELVSAGPGLYQVVLVGVPQPTSVEVRSNLGGTGSMSSSNTLWRVRL